jgi:pimeloyl-ACP methyl ester carboxylesterase
MVLLREWDGRKREPGAEDNRPPLGERTMDQRSLTPDPRGRKGLLDEREVRPQSQEVVPGLIMQPGPTSGAPCHPHIPADDAHAAILPYERVPVQVTLVAHEEAGTTDSPEYEEAMMVFYRRHVCRSDPWPDFVNRTFEALAANPEVYNVMNGPSEFHVIGVIKDFDITADLGKVRVPTLLFSGRYDEVTPATMERVHRGIPGSDLVVFEESSHMSQAEEPDAVLDLVRGS